MCSYLSLDRGRESSPWKLDCVISDVHLQCSTVLCSMIFITWILKDYYAIRSLLNMSESSPLAGNVPGKLHSYELIAHQPGGRSISNFSVVNSDFPQKGGDENPHPADDN